MKPPQLIRLPSNDGHGQYDFHVQPPAGMSTPDALQMVNDTIYSVNREDDENDGECLDGKSVEENIVAKLVAAGFVVAAEIAVSNNWDDYDQNYATHNALEKDRG